MYSRNHQVPSADAFRLPAHYSGVAFAQARGETGDAGAVDAGCCASGLPGGRRPSVPSVPPSPSTGSVGKSEIHTAEHKESPQTCEVGGLFGGIGQEELLLLGIIFLLAQRPGEDDTILLLLLLLLRH